MTKLFDQSHLLGRRQFISMGVLTAAAAAIAPQQAIAKSKKLNIHERALSFYHLHTGESLRSVYWADGVYRHEGLKEINALLRDFRTDEVADIDPQLLDVLSVLSHEVGGAKRPFEIISAYRSPQTNEMLRQASNGVAKKSFHTQGKAIDVRLQGVSLRHLHGAAKHLKAGGVGYYGKSDFIHLDTGPLRSW